MFGYIDPAWLLRNRILFCETATHEYSGHVCYCNTYTESYFSDVNIQGIAELHADSGTPKKKSKGESLGKGKKSILHELKDPRKEVSAGEDVQREMVAMRDATGLSQYIFPFEK